MSGEQGEKVKNTMVTLTKNLYYFKFSAGGTYLITCGSLFFEDPAQTQYFVILFYFTMTFNSIFLVNFCALPVGRMFKEVLDEANKDGTDAKFNALQNKVALFLREVRNNGISNTALCLLFCLPFAHTFVSYQFLFGWTLGCPIIFVAAFFIKPSKIDSNKKKVAPAATATTVTGSTTEGETTSVTDKP